MAELYLVDFVKKETWRAMQIYSECFCGLHGIHGLEATTEELALEKEK